MAARKALSPGRIVLHLTVLLIVALWTLPTAGLFISSLRDKDQIAATGWWTSLTTSERNSVGRLKGSADQVQQPDGSYTVTGNLLEGGAAGGEIVAYGVRVQAPNATKAGEPPTSAKAHRSSSTPTAATR